MNSPFLINYAPKCRQGFEKFLTNKNYKIKIRKALTEITPKLNTLHK